MNFEEVFAAQLFLADITSDATDGAVGRGLDRMFVNIDSVHF